jgi:hypothetical protein
MKKTSTSVLCYGIYLLMLGLVYVTIPNLPLTLLGFAPTDEPWIRVMAACVMILGYYYVRAARSDWSPFYRWTIHTRAFFALATVVFVVLKLAQPMLLLFGLLDLAGALWTGLALRDRNRQNCPETDQ